MNFLGWIDHDPHQERSVLRALNEAKSHEARDELGLGTIRDTFADLFFPGLSSVQTRLRYFLFVQWCCEAAAARRGTTSILDALRNLEGSMIAALRPLGERQGVIGLRSGEALSRMPSDIYWTGLAMLGMRRVRGSRRRWAREVEAAKAQSRMAPPAEDGAPSGLFTGFDPERPNPPDGFPAVPGLDFALQPREAEFLGERLGDACVDLATLPFNLFAAFSHHRRRIGPKVALWDHPRVSRLAPAPRDLLQLARAFAIVMHGAIILYNLLLAELKLKDDHIALDLRDTHLTRLADWQDEVAARDIALLRARLHELPRFGRQTRHGIDERTMRFVQHWAEICDASSDPARNPRARDLVRNREIGLKARAGTSRFINPAALGLWRGEAGGRLDYRWATARIYLNDLIVTPR